MIARESMIFVLVHSIRMVMIKADILQKSTLLQYKLLAFIPQFVEKLYKEVFFSLYFDEKMYCNASGNIILINLSRHDSIHSFIQNRNHYIISNSFFNKYHFSIQHYVIILLYYWRYIVWLVSKCNYTYSFWQSLYLSEARHKTFFMFLFNFACIEFWMFDQ